MGQWEWIIILLLGMGLLVAELISVRRSIRRARDAETPRSPTPPTRNSEREHRLDDR